MPGEKKRGALAISGKVAWRVLFPFRAMKQSAVLIKREADRRKEDLEMLREFRGEAKEAVADVLSNKPRRDDAFEDAMHSRSAGALSVDELYGWFLWKKRIALMVTLPFAVMGLRGALLGALSGNHVQLIVSAGSLLASLPLFFMIALGAQLRLWQLRTRRLSTAEKGGLKDFMREERSWMWATLDPEFGYKKGELQ